MTSVKAGAAIPIRELTTGPVKAGPAIPVYGYTSAPSDRPAGAGAAMPVKLLTASDLRTNGGAYDLAADVQALPVFDSEVGRSVQGGPAVPIYLMGGALAGGGQSTDIVYDLFLTPRLAGSVDGTLAQPGGVGTIVQNTRTVTDTTGKITIAGNQLLFSGGIASYTDPELHYGPIARVDGRTMEFNLTLPDTAHFVRIGFSTTPSSYSTDAIILFNNAGSIVVFAPGNTAASGGYTSAVTYTVRIVLLASGAKWYIKGGAFANWTKLQETTVGSTTSLYPCIFNYDAISTFTKFRIFDNSLPSQYLSGVKVAGFSRYAGNPVMTLRSGKFDAYRIRELRIVIDQNGNKVAPGGTITGYYGALATGVGHWSIGIATSTDNGLTWTRQDTAVISPSGGGASSWYNTDILQPAIIKRTGDGLLMMMAIGWGGTDGEALGVLTSSNGTTWSDGGEKLKQSNFTGITGMGVPTIIRRSASGDYVVLFEAPTAGGHFTIFGATSPDFTGTWTPLNSGNALLSPNSSYTDVSNPQLIEISAGSYLIAYSFISAGFGATFRTGFASTSDFVNWTDYSDNPTLMQAWSGWDVGTQEPSFLDKDYLPLLRLFYQEMGAADYQIGLATN